MKFLGVIPARYGSTRFPGKPLADIGGKKMVQRVYECAARVLEEVWVATDDARIEQAVKAFGGRVIMTSPECPSGTDRCREAADRLLDAGLGPFDVVLNIQGDEPFLHPEILESLMACFEDETAEIGTLVNPVVRPEEIFSVSEAKVVFDSRMNALYFSRSPIPHLMGVDKERWLERHRFYKHVGVYGFRLEVLREITALSVSPLEAAERLEQNRWLENGYKIRVAVTERLTYPVDTPEDLERLRAMKPEEFA